MTKHRKVMTMAVSTGGGLTINKALGAGFGGLVFGSVVPMLLGALNWIHPIAGAFNPILGAFVGVLTGVLTYFVPKNKVVDEGVVK